MPELSAFAYYQQQKNALKESEKKVVDKPTKKSKNGKTSDANLSETVEKKVLPKKRVVNEAENEIKSNEKSVPKKKVKKQAVGQKSEELPEVVPKKKVSRFTQKTVKKETEIASEESFANGTDVSESVKKTVVTKPKVTKAANKKPKSDKTPQNATSKTNEVSKSSQNSSVVSKKSMKSVDAKEVLEVNEASLDSLPPLTGNSVVDGENYLKWLVGMPLKKFFSKHWEKQPLLVKRNNESFVKGICSIKMMDEMIRTKNVQYTVNMDVTQYVDGVRETLNPTGKVFAASAWEFYNDGCSLRLKNPQTFFPQIHKICATLQEHFKSMVGANMYLTPPGTQGFAPHYDDIEAFVLQLEGKKEWKVYKPRSEAETLPKTSSVNFNQDEIGELSFKTVLSPGDMLYFPRGFVHQAKSLPDSHSLHVTISTYQCHTWHDLMKPLLEQAIETAVASDVEFRKGVPLNFFNCVGVQNSDQDTAERRAIFAKVSELLSSLSKYCDVDQVADERSKSFLHDSLPPVLSENEKKCSIHGMQVDVSEKKLKTIPYFTLDTKVRLIRKNSIRIIPDRTEEDQDDCEVVNVYHNLQNPTVYHSEEPKFQPIPSEFSMALDKLLQTYPKFVAVKDLPLENDDLKLDCSEELFDKGFIMTEKPLSLRESNEEE